ncbi:MAG: hypothetical protein GYB25_06850 [Rhodobacteraceae bacterium]|nr:hypothetical protein [Paracoccaceae bacterium]
MTRKAILASLGFVIAAGPSVGAVSTPGPVVAAPLQTEHRVFTQRPAKLIERDLHLSSAQRRAIQANLNLLGFNAGAADGVFGSRTRGAIAAWQRSWGGTGASTGYLNQRQVQRLEAQARSERERRDNETRRADERFWQATGASGRLADLRRYLSRYPSGIHAAEARRMIRRIEAEDDRTEEARRDHAYWRETGADGTEDGLRRYLRIYPNGLHAAEAREALRRIEGGQDARRDHAFWRETGADGSEAGLRRYLRHYPDGLHADEARRALQRYEREEARRDNAFWRETGAGGTEEGLRRYLRRYPDGLHADEARRALRRIEDDRDRADRERQDREAWRAAQSRDTIVAYQSYLSHFPRGRFIAEARARITALLNRPLVGEELANARRIEAEYLAGQMPGRAREIVAALRRLGYAPGRYDGDFDAKTRDAIRALQRKLGKRPTGFVDPWLGAQLQPER